MNTLLIASANEGKIREFRHALSDQSYQVVAVSDLSEDIPEPEEYGKTFAENAVIKAQYYGEKTGMVCLADDGGMCVDILDGWPGVISARIAPNADARCTTVTEAIKKKGAKESPGTFETTLALYNPAEGTMFLAHGVTKGTVKTDIPQERLDGFGYDPIFYVDEAGKTYDEMSVAEKLRWSHRGKALNTMKHHIAKQYGHRQFLCPVALIIRDGKILLSQRSDPHRPDFDKKWEFAGGGLEFGEQPRECLVREVREEIGVEVAIERALDPFSQVQSQEGKQWKYQVVLMPYICSIIAGNPSPKEEEVLQTAWVNVDDVLTYDLVGANAIMYKQLLPAIHDYLDR